MESARVVCLVLDSLDIRIVQGRGWQLGAPKEHGLVDVLGFGDFVIDPNPWIRNIS